MTTSAASTAVNAAQSSAVVIGAAAGSQNTGIWDSARQIFSMNFLPKELQFLTSQQRAKPASAVNADDFYMYACGSLNMP